MEKNKQSILKKAVGAAKKVKGLINNVPNVVAPIVAPGIVKKTKADLENAESFGKVQSALRTFNQKKKEANVKNLNDARKSIINQGPHRGYAVSTKAPWGADFEQPKKLRHDLTDAMSRGVIAADVFKKDVKKRNSWGF